MKKMFAMVLVLVMLAVMTACGSKAKVKKDEPVSQAETQKEETKEEESKEAEESEEQEAAEEQSMIVGGWTRPDSPEITDEIRSMMKKANEVLAGAQFEPVSLIATQLVSGTNYRILCKETATVPDAKTYYAVVTLYADLNGNVEITEILNSEAEAVAAVEGVGSWAVVEPPVVTEEAKTALDAAQEKKLGAEYEAVALLGTQLVSGTNYCLLCEITPVVPNPEVSYAIVTVYCDLEGNAEITDFIDFVAAE